MYREEGWEEIEQLLGKIVMRWGRAMGLVYSLPQELKFENPDAIRLGLAQLSGDGTRLSHMRKLIAHEPKLMNDTPERAKQADLVLKAFEQLVGERDALIHGVPLSSYQRDIETMKEIRRGAYMVQQREWKETSRYLKVPETAEQHLQKLEVAYDELLRVARPMLFEDWVAIFGKFGQKVD